jgi:hypothetical protein
MSISNDDAREIMNRIRELAITISNGRGDMTVVPLLEAIAAVAEQTEEMGYIDL